MHLDCSIYVDILFIRSRLDISHKESSHWSLSRLLAFFAQLCEKRIHIILHINLRAVAHISNLSDISR